MRNNAANVQLDAIDRAILEVLQHEGRIANQDLAQRVHLSPSACLRRVKTLEDHIQTMANTYGIPGPVPVSVSNKEQVPIECTYEVVG